MTDEEIKLKEKISDLKKHWHLIPAKGHEIDISNFNLLTKGDAFRKIYTWQCPNISQHTYVVEYDNSYRLNVVKAERTYNPTVNTSRYLAGYIVFEDDFPDFIVRPNNLSDKLFNLFFKNQIKVNIAKQFNSRYILESVDSDTIEYRLGKVLFDLVVDTSGVYIEVVN